MAIKTASGIGLLEAAAEKALFGLSLSERQGDLFAHIEQNRTVVASCGRQSVKTMTASVTAIWNLLLQPHLDEKARGSARHVIVVANSREQARITLTFAREFCERSPLLRSELLGVREDKLVLKGSRVLIAVPCADRVARGLRASALIFDEAGHFLSEAFGPRTLERIYVALRPSLATFGEEGKVLVASTPGESGFFARLYMQAESGELPGAAAFTATTEQMNPEVSAEFRVRVERARRPFLLAVGETFARGWRVEAAGQALSDLAHVRVNGYANGWRLPRGTYELTITYGPERLARLAGRFDLVLIPLVVGLWVGATLTRRRRSRAPDRSAPAAR